MSWEEEFSFGNNKGENTLDVIPPIIYAPLRCTECKNEHHPEGPITYVNQDGNPIFGIDEFGEQITLECTSTRYIGQKI